MALLQPFIERAAVGMVVDRPAIEGQHTVAGALRCIGHPTVGVKDLLDRFAFSFDRSKELPSTCARDICAGWGLD